MTFKTLTISLIGILFLAFVGCQTQPAGEATETEEVETTETKEEDKSKRESPPKEAMATLGSTQVTINYGSPGVKGRTIWGDLVAYDEVWRTGANEATTIEVSGPVTIEGQALPAGKYSFFTIPGEQDWTLIFNSVSEQWGAYDYADSADVLRVKVMPEEVEEVQERMAFTIAEDGKVVLAWDKLRVPFMVAEAAAE
jgi:hypothetical protein